MKNTIKIVVFTLLFTSLSFSQAKGYGEVDVIEGIEVYLLNEPVRSYEIVYNKGQGINLQSFITDGKVNESIYDKVKKFARAINRKSKSENKKVDALLYTGGKEVIAIKFTDKPTEKTKRKAKIKEYGGIPSYIMCEPYEDFTTVRTKNNGLKMKSYVTKGWINNSIEQDFKKFTNKFAVEYKEKIIDALFYMKGKSCDGIKFK